MALILIVDDAAFTRRMIRKALVAVGHETLEASHGKEGLDMVKNHNPDCIFIDLLMPIMDGFAVLEALRDRKSKIPVFVISADIQEGVRQRCLELGASGFINKPPKEEELHQTLEKALGKAQEMLS
ncbi:MAG: response regulator [Scytonema sp. PMC 1069.18]|nr:response regulator [Scytonema sp. PMC 1069.18]MEC4886300.1 response regulator [Scytonema sp. PMC 1070.18]